MKDQDLFEQTLYYPELSPELETLFKIIHKLKNLIVSLDYNLNYIKYGFEEKSKRFEKNPNLVNRYQINELLDFIEEQINSIDFKHEFIRDYIKELKGAISK